MAKSDVLVKASRAVLPGVGCMWLMIDLSVHSIIVSVFLLCDHSDHVY